MSRLEEYAAVKRGPVLLGYGPEGIARLESLLVGVTNMPFDQLCAAYKELAEWEKNAHDPTFCGARVEHIDYANSVVITEQTTIRAPRPKEAELPVWTYHASMLLMAAICQALADRVRDVAAELAKEEYA